MLTVADRDPFDLSNSPWAAYFPIVAPYPYPLPGLMADYDPNNGSVLGSDGLSVAALPPFVGTVTTPLTTGPATQPNLDLIGLNGRKTLTFDGAGDYLQALFACAQPYTDFVVWRLNAWVANKVVMEGAAASTGRVILNSASPSIRMTSGATDSSLGAAPLGVFGISTLRWDNLNSTYQLNNGPPIGFEGAGTAASNGMIFGTGVNASGVPSASLASSVTLARILRYVGNPSDATATAIYSGLKAQYAI